MKKFFVLGVVLCSLTSYGQQLDQIGKKGGVKVSGGVGMSNNFYVADGISNRLNPYSYVLSGNVNISLYGFSLPFSFAFSNQNFSYRQPFNIYGLSPTYKKWTFHAGYRNLSFSPYTLNGHNFLGGGVEYRGDKLSVAAMSGRLLKAVNYDSTNANVLPSYSRMGGGIKVNYKAGSDEVFVVAFYAKDIVGSINEVPEVVGLRPQENMVWSIGGTKVLFEKLTLHAEGARSAWTRDVTTESDLKPSTLSSKLYFMPWKQSTQVYTAFKANATYDFSFMNLGAGYERVEPEYQTLGAYYFNNDLENITVNFSTALFQKKVNISANGGLQRDDLNNQKASKMNRKVGSVNMGIVPSRRLNINLAYSNFYSFVNVKPVDVTFLQNTIFADIDTLNYTQISQTVNGSVSYKLSENDHISRTISVNSSLMSASNKQGRSSFGNQMANGNVMFNQSWKKSGISLGVNTNANQTSYEQGNSLFVGVGVNAGAPVFKKKLRVSLSLNANQNYEKDQLVARLYSVSNTYSIRLGKKHSLSANMRYSGRAKLGEASLGRYNATFNEFMGAVGYNYTF
ncbi:MAG TPA: hypothetical protein VIK89_04855 [Cytophagaceae bacterium]